MKAKSRLIVEEIDANGKVKATHVGPSQKELYHAHLRHDCDMFCGYCYEEAMKSIGESK